MMVNSFAIDMIFNPTKYYQNVSKQRVWKLWNAKYFPYKTDIKGKGITSFAFDTTL